MSAMRCPGQDSRFMKPQDVAEAECPECGHTVEFWPDEPVRRCRECNRPVVNPGHDMKCLEWCDHASECLSAIRSSDTLGALREEVGHRMAGVFGDDADKIQHTLSVLGLAEEIGRREDADPMVLIPAAILHDLGRSVPNAGEETDRIGRRLAEEALEGLPLPGAIREEILDLVEHHHDREFMERPNGAPLYDADLVVNLAGRDKDDQREALEREALTETGLRLGRRRLGL